MKLEDVCIEDSEYILKVCLFLECIAQSVESG
jgi:hypothetical protein